jgi:hypothetical protein
MKMKMKMKNLLIAGVAALLVLSVGCGMMSAQTASPPPPPPSKYIKKVANALEKEGYSFEFDSDGDLKVEVLIGLGRTHLVWVMMEKSTFGEVSVRDVYSMGWLTQEDSLGLSEPDCMELLLMNETTKIGAWSILEEEEKRAYLYTVKALADVDINVLIAYIEGVAIVGDHMEKEFEEGGLLPNIDTY